LTVAGGTDYLRAWPPDKSTWFGRNGQTDDKVRRRGINPLAVDWLLADGWG
jgi:hypothetical protein